METKQQKLKELREKIFAKRQQIDFERTELEVEENAASDNSENPDVSEEMKNYDDRPENAVDSTLVSSVKTSQDELDDLIRQLDALLDD